MNDQQKIKDYKFLEECCLYPHSEQSLKVLTENDEGSFLMKEDIVELIEVLKRYVA